MKRFLFIHLSFIIIATAFGLFFFSSQTEMSSTILLENVSELKDTETVLDDPLGLFEWKRPEGPLRVGIQAGHWKYEEAPDEQEGVRNNGGTTSASGVPEWKVNLVVAEKIAEKLRQEGIEVDILPATIPPDYWADAFVSLHADGNINRSVTGYKVAAARRDMSGKAEILSQLIEQQYGLVTKMALDPNVTRTMRGYYAFNWRRYDHALHPMTPGVIVEMGFLSNPNDARLLLNNPELPAQAIAESLVDFLKPTSPESSI